MKSLLSNQIKAKNHLQGWKVGALFMEPGTAKTRVALELVNQSPCDGVIWVAPLRTIQNAKDEVAKWGGFNIPAYYYGVESISQSDRIFNNMMSDLDKCKNPFVVCDESLKIKNKRSKRTQRMLLVGSKVEYKLILNGTPISRDLLDLWAQMEFLSPLILNMTYNEFKDTFCKYTQVKERRCGRVFFKEFITGYENVDYLYSLIRHYVFRCSLTLQITQFYHTIDYYLTADEMEEYNAIKLEYLCLENILENANIFMAMTQKLQNFYCTCENKMKEMDELMNKIGEEGTVIFCKFIKSQEECKRRYKKALVLSYQKESLGLNLQNYNKTVYFDKTWDYAMREQSTNRTYRTGQEHNCEYWDLTGNVGLEGLIDKNISKKVSVSQYLKSVTIEDLKNEI